MATKKTDVHTFPTSYEENAEEGIRYLEDDLSYEEAKVFFDQARTRGSAELEDDEDRQFTLSYQNGAYTLIRRT
ncbi:MAG: hypothetical protein A3B37_02460 [Candidatus Sungbacteria bacterium RIFCSPLOWO2_01_FULL_59_16]|uniref:Uncharacterized protein n=1 Tax=Candidatus Sungbacteria bacterium RIFCSPLOWO2_01_FULL_59_16 TaxID=1802280 RepID=A0A1G2LF05_9BACT|nr:MAG: hypothetical protein A3B37_02460 [Candidatus Sungbacteria bacterium RIFCSPLOWO2_01_FULL_59_16]